MSTAQLSAGAVTAAEIAANTITAGQIAANTITSGQIAAGAITTAAISAGAVTAGQIAANTITSGQIAAGAITAASLAAGSVTASQLAANSVTASAISAGSVSTASLAAGAVTAATIAANTITSGQIAAGAITTAAISAGAVTAGQIAANTITSSQIAAGAITAAQLAAGAVTTSSLAVGSATNLCWNACLELVADGWEVSSSQVVTGWGPTKGVGGLDPQWRLQGFGDGYAEVANQLATTDYLSIYWTPNSTDSTPFRGISIAAGAVVEVSAQIMPHRCGGRVDIQWLDVNANVLLYSHGNRVVQAVPANGQTLASYQQSWLSMTAPAGAVAYAPYVDAFNDGGADIAAIIGPNPFVFFSQFSAGPGVPNATQPAPWTPGGVSSISGGMIRADTIQASAIVANSITAAQIAANTITAGEIAAGAITAAQIAVGSLSANLLASNFQLTNSAQIGNAIITNAQIANLTVGTGNVANSAITNIAWTQQTIATGDSSGTTFGTSITTTGANVLVTLTVAEYLVGSGNAMSALYRDSTLLIPNIFHGSAAIIDSPPAGTYTYQVIATTGPESLYTIVAMEIKK